MNIMKKKVLVIAPSSIPVFGAEAIVNSKLLELLTNNDFEVDLISKRSKWENYPADQNLNDLNIHLNEINIVEVDNRFNGKTFFQHLMAFLTFGTVFKGAHWAYIVISKYKKLFKNRSYDYVLTKNSPSLLVGYYLKKRYKYKWVASWNDPYPAEKYPEPYGRGPYSLLPWYHKNVLSIMEKADLHIFPSSRLENYMKRYIDIGKNSSVIAPHIVFEEEKSPKPKTDTLKILYSGNLRLPRDPKFLVSAVSKLLKENSDLSLSIDIVGVYDEFLKGFISENNLSHVFNLIPPIKYKENLRMLSNYDIAVIIEADCEEGIFLPTKVGDYMQGKVPIFTISPKNGLLNDLYHEGFIQYFAGNNSEEIYIELKRIYSDFLTKDGLRKSEFYEPYNSKNILKTYLSI